MPLISNRLPSLPLNAKDFFVDKPKPNHYLYSQRGGLLSVEVKSVADKVPIVNAKTNEVKQLEQPKRSFPKLLSSKSVLPKNTVSQRHRVIHQSPTPYVPCNYLVSIPQAGCSCSSYECNNPKCPLSKILPSGVRAKQNLHNCTEENCRWHSKHD